MSSAQNVRRDILDEVLPYAIEDPRIIVLVCDMGFGVDHRTGRLIMVSVIDNLVKGAAGQAVQNMNVMLGLPQETGLQWPPYPL